MEDSFHIAHKAAGTNFCASAEEKEEVTLIKAIYKTFFCRGDILLHVVLHVFIDVLPN